MKSILIILLSLYSSFKLYTQNTDSIINSENWNLEFKYSSDTVWNKVWFLDGSKAKVSNLKTGMLFKAGPVDRDDSSHAVLWTHKIFKGDLKIEYDYIRTDSQIRYVNVLYVYAQGSGEAPYNTDISKWNDLRKVAAMRTYYQNMDLLHISYAAFKNDGSDTNDYIRIRKYPVVKGENFNKSTEIPPAIFKTGMFKTGVTYKITVVISGNDLLFKIVADNKEQVYKWDISKYNIEKKGRIGFRHMCTRSAIYNNIRIYSRKN